MTYTLGGTISGLGVDSGLVLLNNGEDVTTIAANSTAFTMNTRVASGSAYDITVGKQPYGLTLACSISGGSGTVSANVTSITVSCLNVAPTQNAVAGYFLSPRAVAVDASGNVFVANTGVSSIKKIPYSGGNYGTPVTLGSGFGYPYGVAVDASGNVFVADTGNNAVKEIPYSGGSYGAPVILASGLLTPTQVAQGYFGPTGIAVSRSGNLFVMVAGVLDEIPFSGGSYGGPVTVSSGFSYPEASMVVDANGDLFVADTQAVYEVLEEIPFSGGIYGTPLTLASVTNPLDGQSVVMSGLAVDKNGDLFVADIHNAVWEISYSGGHYGTSVAMSSGLINPGNLTVDANDNLFVRDGTTAVQEIPYSGGTYHTAITVTTSLNQILDVAVSSAHENVLVVQSGEQQTLTEIPFSGGAYQNPVPLSLGVVAPLCLTLDANDDLFVVDGASGTLVQESPFSGSGYYPLVAVGTVLSEGCSGIAADAHHNVFVASNGGVYEFPVSGGSYGAPITLDAGSGNVGGVAVDTNGNVFVADTTNNAVKEIPFSGGSYGNPIALGSGLKAPKSVAVDKDGRLYVLDSEYIWRLSP
jgi:sugar lactone lactonase YvrE